MKILYFAHDRRVAQAAAQALRRLFPNATVSWAQSPGAAAGWLGANRDARAVLVHPDAQSPGGSSVLEHARSLGLDTPVAVMAPEQLDAMSAMLRTNHLDAAAPQVRGDVIEAQLREIEQWRREAQERLAQDRAQNETALARGARMCTALQERLLELERALHDADERHASQATANEQLAQRERELSAALAAAAAARTATERRLADADAALQQAQQRAAEELDAALDRHRALEQRLSRETEVRTTLEERVAAAESARIDADRRHAAALAAQASRLADRWAAQEASLGRTNRICAALQQRLLELEAEIDRLTLRESELGAAVAGAIAARAALEHVLAETGAAQQRAAADLGSATERCAALERQLSEQETVSARLEHRLDTAAAARRDAEEQHAAERTSLLARVADAEQRCNTAIWQGRALERQLHGLSAELQDARRERSSEVSALTEQLARHETEAAAALDSLTTRLAEVQSAYESATEQRLQRETELGVSLAEAMATRTAVENRLAEAEAAHADYRERSAAERDAAARKHAEFEGRLDEAALARTSLEERLAAAETTRHREQEEHAAAAASLTARLADLQGHYDVAAGAIEALEGRLADAEDRLATREAELGAALAEARAARAAVEEQLAAARAEHQRARDSGAADLAAAAERRAALEGQLDAGSRDLARLQRETDSLKRQLDALRTHAAGLRRDAERVPVLQGQIDAGRKENRRQFERAPYGLCECTPDGVVTRANHSLARLLGYRRSTDLQRPDELAGLFECAADLRWLIERTQRSGKVESVETTLRTRDRRRLFLRLHAVTIDGPIVIAFEDQTRLAALEQRLREAGRMEAVARVASEVAVTCDSLLQDVSQGGRQWLAGFASDAPMRQQGEVLLGDVNRAAGFLRQFVVYGNKQINNLEPVCVQRVLRDMEHVLKRVLGDDILLMLPKTTHRFEVDADSEQVERILINVANQARERMPQGGRVKIQLSTTVVDQRLRARHPRLRPGDHVLITFTETHGAARPPLPVQLSIPKPLAARGPGSARESPGIDPGPLVGLIGSLDGHLWMSVEPAGHMTVRIHLPKRTQDEVTESAVAGSWANRGRQLAKWFRH